MRKMVVIGLLGVLGLAIFSVNALTQQEVEKDPWYTEEDVEVTVKKIGNGIELRITAEDPEIIKDIQKNYRWYRTILSQRMGMGGGYQGMYGSRDHWMRSHCPMMSGW